MIRSILWKEARQHGGTFVVLAVASLGVMLGAVGLLALDQSINRVSVLGMMVALIVLLSLATSLLSGALLTGSDNEEKTRPWLDSLPGAAWKRWLTQVGFACAAQAAMMAFWGSGWLLLFWNDLGQDTAPKPLVTEAVFFTLMIVSGLAWGQWGGHRSKSVFGGFGVGLIGIVAALLGFFVFQVLFSILSTTLDWRSSTNDHHGGRHLVLELTTVLLAIFFGIILPFGFVAREYYRGSVRVSLIRLSPIRSLVRWGWLSCQTAWGPVLGLFIVGVVLGFVLQSSFLIWPIWGLLVGVICGLGILGPDQDGENSFNGTMRAFRPLQFDLRVLPALLTSLALLITPLIPMTVGLLYQEIFLAKHHHDTERGLSLLAWEGVGTFFPIGPWIVIWWSAGFGAALWTSLFLDKWIVSLVVSLGLGALLSCVWVPSLWGDSLSTWWPIGTAVIFWVLARFLYRYFCANTLAARGLSAFATMVAAIGLFSALGLISRFWFVPNPPSPFDVKAIAKSFTNPDARLVDEVTKHLPSYHLGQTTRSDQQEIATAAWGPNLDKPVGVWEDKEKNYFKNNYKKIRDVYIEKWPIPQEVFSFYIANNPNISDPNIHSIGDFNYHAFNLIRLRLLHAVWQVENGQQADLPEELERVLYLSACIRHKGNLSYFQTGKTLERLAFTNIANFLSDGKPEEKTLAEMTAVLDRHKVRMTKVDSIPTEVGYYISLKSLDNLMVFTAPFAGSAWGRSEGNSRLYWDLFNFAMKAPWELERKRRLINMWYSGDITAPYFPQKEDIRSGKTSALVNPVPYWYFNPLANGRAEYEQYAQNDENREKTGLDLARIAIAAKRYQIANKAFPKSLADLAPKYLAEIPKDSFTHAEFRFRIALAPKAEDKKKAPDAKPTVPSAPAGSAGSPEGSSPEDSGPAGVGMAMGGMGMAGADPDEIIPDSLSIVRGRELKALKPGTLVIWSIGPDGTDQGGIRDGGGFRNSPNQPFESDDMLFLVGP